MKEKRIKHPDWKTSASERRWYFFSQTARYAAQALLPAHMAMFLLFNGIDTAVVAVITLAVKCIDAVDDMIFGYLVDKIDLKKNRFLAKIGGEGRYMPWIRCFLMLYPIATALFFLMPSSMSPMGKVIWFAVTYLLYDLTYTLVDVPVQSTLMTITDVPEERNHMITVSFVCVTGAMIVLTALQTLLISESVGMSISHMALMFIAIYAVCMLPLIFKIKEHNAELKNVNAKTEEKYTVREMLAALWNNKPYLALQIANVIPAMLATGTGVSLFVSFYLYGSSTAMVVPSLIASVLIIVAQMLAPMFSKRFENKNIVFVCYGVMFVCGLATYFAGFTRFGIVVALTLVSSVFNGLATMIKGYMGPQCIEYGKYTNGRDATGIFNAISTFLGKTTSSVASSLGIFMLGLFGWVSVNVESFADLAAQNVQQTGSALNGLWILNTIVPAVGSLIGLIALRFYKLKDEDVRLMGKCNAGEISREECEAKLHMKCGK